MRRQPGKNIVLTGFMGTGKTEVGKQLSRILGWKMIDIDDELERSRNMTISELFETLGEPAFRDMESEMIRKIAGRRRTIISTGGGAVLRQENREALQKNGFVVNLTATHDTILKRTSGSGKRPLLQVEDPRSRIKELLEARRASYAVADLLVDTESKTPRQIAEEILVRMGWKR